jgi:hypothetical protein
MFGRLTDHRPLQLADSLTHKVAREWGLGPPTRKQQREIRAEIRNQEPKLRPEQIDKNSYRHPEIRERAPPRHAQKTCAWLGGR